MNIITDRFVRRNDSYAITRLEKLTFACHVVAYVYKISAPHAYEDAYGLQKKTCWLTVWSFTSKLKHI